MWTAPDLERVDPPALGDERRMLEGWLDWHRQTLLLKCAGLDEDRLRLRAVEPSTLSLLGLVRHMTEVERSWFRRRIAGEDIAWVHCSDASPDADFDDIENADAAADFDAYHREIEAARAAAAGRGLDETFFHTHRKMDMSVRWVYLHMIEEYARHNGHADLLRERIDGATGF